MMEASNESGFKDRLADLSKKPEYFNDSIQRGVRQDSYEYGPYVKIYIYDGTWFVWINPQGIQDWQIFGEFRKDAQGNLSAVETSRHPPGARGVAR